MKTVKREKYFPQKIERIGNARPEKPEKPVDEMAGVLGKIQDLIVAIDGLANKPVPEAAPVPAQNIIVRPADVKIDMPKPAKKWKFNGKRSWDGEWKITAERVE